MPQLPLLDQSKGKTVLPKALGRLGVIICSAIVFAVVMISVRSNGFPLGNSAQWFAAIGTVGTLIGTTTDLHRQRTKDNFEKRRESASWVSAWVQTPNADQVTNPGSLTHGWELVLHNGSRSPLDTWDVQPVIQQGGATSFHESFGSDRFGTIPPGTKWRWPLDDALCATAVSKSTHFKVELRFRDPDGLAWRRDDGVLREQDVSERKASSVEVCNRCAATEVHAEPAAALAS